MLNIHAQKQGLNSSRLVPKRLKADYVCQKILCWWNPFQLVPWWNKLPWWNFATLAAHESLPMAFSHSFLETRPQFFEIRSLSRNKSKQDPHSQVRRLSAYVKQVAVADGQRGSSFMLSSSWNWCFYSILFDAEHHDGIIPCFNFATTLTTIGSWHELATSLSSTCILRIRAPLFGIHSSRRNIQSVHVHRSKDYSRKSKRW